MRPVPRITAAALTTVLSAGLMLVGAGLASAADSSPEVTPSTTAGDPSPAVTSTEAVTEVPGQAVDTVPPSKPTGAALVTGAAPETTTAAAPPVTDVAGTSATDSTTDPVSSPATVTATAADTDPAPSSTATSPAASSTTGTPTTATRTSRPAPATTTSEAVAAESLRELTPEEADELFGLLDAAGLDERSGPADYVGYFLTEDGRRALDLLFGEEEARAIVDGITGALDQVDATGDADALFDLFYALLGDEDAAWQAVDDFLVGLGYEPVTDPAPAPATAATSAPSTVRGTEVSVVRQDASPTMLAQAITQVKASPKRVSAPHELAATGADGIVEGALLAAFGLAAGGALVLASRRMRRRH